MRASARQNLMKTKASPWIVSSVYSVLFLILTSPSQAKSQLYIDGSKTEAGTCMGDCIVSEGGIKSDWSAFLREVGKFKSLPVARYPESCEVRQGEASVYGSNGDSFAGKKTASGEVMDPSKLRAAHVSLPLGSKVEVCNPEGGKCVIVTINDRGPYQSNGQSYVRHPSRVIDLSNAARKVIGLSAGVHPVQLRVVHCAIKGPRTRIAKGT